MKELRLRTGLLILIVSMLTTVSCSRFGGDEPGVETTHATEPMLRRVIEHEGLQREYFVHIPTSLHNSTEKPPVVVAIHGYTSTATGFQAHHGLNRNADEHSYITVYPQGSHFLVDGGQGNKYRITSWNDLAANQPPNAAGPHCADDRDQYPCPPECGECNHCAWTSCNDDVGFIARMIDAVKAEFDTDERRYYLLGVSNGGMMTLRLGCDLSNVFAAVAPIIGQLAPGHSCGPDSDVPMIHLFGGNDDTVRFDGSAGSDGFMYTSAAETAEVWAKAMQCDDQPGDWENEYSRKAGVKCTAYTGCSVNGHEVVSCMDPAGTHVWPSQMVQALPSTCVTEEQYESIPDQARCETTTGNYTGDGMNLVWDFFSRYRTHDDPQLSSNRE